MKIDVRVRGDYISDLNVTLIRKACLFERYHRYIAMRFLKAPNPEKTGPKRTECINDRERCKESFSYVNVSTFRNHVKLCMFCVIA